MLPVIQHNHDRFVKNFPFCGNCPDLSTRTGLCKNGIDHQSHCNADYCPAGKFGGSKPAEWPQAEEDRLRTCRKCKMHDKDKQSCTKDGASIRDHVREALCPLGSYVDGVVGSFPPRPAPPATAQHPSPAAAKPGGCCGG